MIEHLNKKGTIRLIAAMYRCAEHDIRFYKRRSITRCNADYVSMNAYESAERFINEELPGIKEVLCEYLKEK